MKILETILMVPVMFYVSLILLPPALVAYRKSARPRKAVMATEANPADVLKEKTVDTKREGYIIFFLASSIALAGSIIYFGWGIVEDYKRHEGLFAVQLPDNALPPSQGLVFPPKPPVAAVPETGSDTGVQ